MAQQLRFPLPRTTARGREDFFVSPANALAHETLANPGAWPLGKMVLSGPEGSGKSHLAEIWRRERQATVVRATGLDEEEVGRSIRGAAPAVVVEDADRPMTDAAQRALFHLHNMVAQRGGLLLLTARQAPARWPVTLPDLASRMQGTALVEIAPPDDQLLTALFVKLFHDRQILPPPALIAWLLPRMERSYAAVAKIVSELDRRALDEKRPIGQRLAADVLDNLARNAR
ncbi:hypothetical protein BV394_13650 [Brevirhabdus pacifica]|uniref:Uncharacterized protein n=1 Tax=Brevirhabdus pacifica TaxID=1267768 RepID=A0A1U7DKY3_9RHOB|nr:hypothetical protein [Brevirhabdus pacifica]APX90632.1 hypothetical protein BV394_13650 [Brevirhabdus pacifica]OWU78377.1 hypothetical protein ATO5_05815 [Loktanella sp. 22II-4b]PJJ85225.1 hypothetical protein CLV77_2091 [Brevirhabdus pacifica]